jgi:hypothetical protein
MQQIGKTIAEVKRSSSQCLDASVSYYKNQEPATREQIGRIIHLMSKNYDKKANDFWLLLMDFLLEKKWSEERIRYAAFKLMEKVKFHTWTIAEFVEMDREIERFTGAEAENLPPNHKPLVNAKFEDRWWICYKEDADRLGLEYKIWITENDKKQNG